MTAPVGTARTRLPFAPGAVRDFLRQDADFTAFIPQEFITTRDLPRKITRPFALIRPAVTQGSDPMYRKALVQIDICVPPQPILGRGEFGIASADPEEVAWDLAGLAAEIIGRASNVTFRNCSWKGHWIDGPLLLPDKSRGEDQIIFRAPVRVRLDMKLQATPTFSWLP